MIPRSNPFASLRRLLLGAGMLVVCAAPAAARAEIPGASSGQVPADMASDPAASDAGAPDDPWEGFNRKAFSFNRGLDRFVMGPVGHAYMRITPGVVRHRVSSVVANLGEPRTAINDLAQGRARAAGVTTSRFLINSTVGGLGLFDVGGKLGLEGHESDFGQTLGRYGAGSGRYVVLPLLGPTTLRDGAGRLVDTMTDPVAMATAGGSSSFTMVRSGVAMVDGRASADGFFRLLDDSTDPYATIRSAYLQGRADMVRQARGGAQVLPDFNAVTIQR